MSFVCIKNLCFSLEFKFIKLSFNSKAFSDKDCLKSEYSSHSNRKCVSLSMEFVLQNLHSLSFNGVFGLVYRPVSIAIGRLHERNSKRMVMWICTRLVGGWKDGWVVGGWVGAKVDR